MDFTAAAKAIEPDLIALRRESHANPELDIETVWTVNRVCEELDSLNIPYTRLDENQVVGLIGTRGSQNIAIRADMDGLPVAEETGLPFASTNGNMHACGHDGHVTMLVGAARLLKQVEDELAGAVHLCFQSAEETGRGAGVILDHLRSAGGVDQVIAIHLWADVDSGKVSIVPGPRMAGADGFRITVNGIGGHGSRPDLAIDPIKPAAAIVLAISSIPTNMVSTLEPSVVHVGSLQAGTAANVFPPFAKIEGGVRSFFPESKASMMEAIRRISEHTAQAYGATAEVEIVTGVPPVINDKDAVARADLILEEMGTLTNDEFERICASENYSLFVEQYPGFMAYLGVRRPDVEQYYQHHPKYDIDEAVLALGAEFFARYSHRYLTTTAQG